MQVYNRLLQVKRKQQMVLQVLEVKRIPFVKKDIASGDDDRKEFRRLMTSLGDANALPPQIFNGDRYIGVSSVLFAVIVCVCKLLKVDSSYEVTE